MPINDYKEITIPEGVVKKIEDSNGNMIWGSQTYYPYRRLEYIHFSGAEGIDLGFKPGSSGNTGVQKVQAKITGHVTSVSDYGVIIGCAGDNTSSGNMRILIQTYQTNVGSRIGRNTSTFGHTTPINANQYYIYRLRTTSASSTYVDIQDENGTLITGTNQNVSTSYTSNNMPNEQLMRYNAAGSIISNGYAIGDIKRFIQQQTDGASTIIKDMYPCQRKSDGVCGLYDTINSTFYPMQGTDITITAAGPIIDEYWDLIA